MVYGEWGQSAYLEHDVPLIEGLDGVAFHAVEIMQNTEIEETEQNLEMQSSYRSKMAMRENKIWIHRRNQKAIKGKDLANHLTENPLDADYEPLTTYFPYEEVLFAGEDIAEAYPRWRMFFDGAANFKRVRIGAVLISEPGQHYPASAKIRFPCTNNMVEYEACILGIRMAVDMNVKELLVIGDSDLLIHQVQGEWSTKNVKILPYLHCVKELCKKLGVVDALATLSPMIQHPEKNYINPIEVEIRDQYAHFFHIDEEPNGKPWYHDIRRFLVTREYPENAINSQSEPS
ncbi:uncharacterized protein LOC142169633 [Nicotiana tabacum]|uniref:Uncharacterized protein LOC142169633 n=1 Tax=Nicotiana tabacum TaxID=4097 RepID=A0AC58SRM2_TOBAC